jgi:hypothetical protein
MARRAVLAVIAGALLVACAKFSAAEDATDAGTNGANACAGCVVTIADGEHAPFALAVDTTFVYWTSPTDGTVSRKPKDGSGQVERLATGQPSPHAITVTPKYVYWGNTVATGMYGEKIVRQALSCTANGCLEIAAADVAEFLAFDGANAFYARDAFFERFDDTNVAELCNSGNTIGAAAIGTNALFAALTEKDAVVSCPKAGTGGNAGSIGDTLPKGLSSIAVADAIGDGGVRGSDVYVTFDVDQSTSAGVSVARIAPGAGGEFDDVASIATGERNAHGIAVDDTFVYWTATGDGAIRRRRRDLSSPPESIATGEESPTFIAVDATGIYWVTAHAIKKRTKS